MMKGIALILLGLLASSHVDAQAFTPRKGSDIVLRTPLEVGLPESSGKSAVLKMEVGWKGNGISVNGRKDWETVGFAPAGSFEVKGKRLVDSASGQVVQLGNDSSGVHVEIILPADGAVAKM